MFGNPSLVTRIAVGKTVGLAFGLIGFLMMPYILSILALILMSRRAQVPAALMVPFNKGER